MECQPCDSKKLFKVFDASKRKRIRKKQEADDSNSSTVVTDHSTGGGQGNGRRISSTKASVQDMPPTPGINENQEVINNRERDHSPSITRSPDGRRQRSPRRQRRIAREGISLALKAGLVSTPRSITPNPQEGDDAIDSVPHDHDSFIYAFLEEAIKRDKKNRHRQSKHEEHSSHHDESSTKGKRHHHRHHRDETRDRHKSRKEEKTNIDHMALLETFAKLCAQMNQTAAICPNVNPMPRCHSHKSLQCEVASKRDCVEAEQTPVQLHSRNQSKDNLSPSRTRSHDHYCTRNKSRDVVPRNERDVICNNCESYEREPRKYSSKANMENGRYSSKANIEPGRYSSKANIEPGRYYDYDRYEYPPRNTQTRCRINGQYRPNPQDEDERIRDYEDQKRKYEEKRHLFEQKASRSFDTYRESYVDEKKYRRTSRSDGVKDKHYEDTGYKDRKYEDRCTRKKYYDERDIRQKKIATLPTDNCRSRRDLERFEKMSIASREDYRERDRYSEKERDSGLSAVDGETSTVSEKSNYLRVVKQEISEQREAMDKMMQLWKELMRCFKGVSQTQGTDKTNESADSMRESAAAQLRLWRECMRRYETVARDVGDTDARLMEEINKQRSEMAEMANMWQECLQRYRDMSNDFNSLKQQLATSESPTRAAAPPLVCAEGEGPVAAPQYRIPPNYPQMPPIPPGYPGGSPLRSRASAPPAWWWAGDQSPPRRRSSPDSRGSRDRRHRHKDRDRDDSRYKEKSKASGARSEHKHRKR